MFQLHHMEQLCGVLRVLLSSSQAICNGQFNLLYSVQVRAHCTWLFCSTVYGCVHMVTLTQKCTGINHILYNCTIYWKCNFPMNPYVRLFGWLVGALDWWYSVQEGGSLYSATNTIHKVVPARPLHLPPNTPVPRGIGLEENKSIDMSGPQIRWGKDRRENLDICR